MAVTRSAFGRIACLTLLVASAVCAGAHFRPQPAARAGVRETTPKEHFLAGSERSVPVLKEISATLRQIDARLAKMEKTVAEGVRRQDNR